MSAALCSTLAALAFTAGVTAALGPVADLPIVNAVISPDGFPRAAALAGGVFPGPLITGNKGDRLRLNVINKLTNHTMLKSTSIHWHGFFQKGVNWADGGAFVNQCPISSGHSFMYDFKAAKQAGTFWYHSHLSSQYCDGIRGAMVIYDPKDPHRRLYDVDNEKTVITLADWYHTAARLGSRIPTADSTLINGKGRWLGQGSLSVIYVRRGKHYRFRLVSTSCDPNYTFSIDGHDMKVIEADGISTKPLTVDQIQIFAGQRYSFVLNANRPVKNYWIRANPNLGMVGFEGGINSAILRYRGAPVAEPTTPLVAATKPLVEADLRPLEKLGVPGGKCRDCGVKGHNLVVDYDFTGGKFTINNASFAPPSVPVLLQVLSGAQTARDLLPSGSLIELPMNRDIQLSFPMAGHATIGAPHPFHLHGHAFAVVRSAGSTEYNFKNPVWRDVVSAGTAGDNVTIRFRTDNPGPWFLHCHIDFHLEAGLAVVMAEALPQVKDLRRPPKAWSELCPIYNALPEAEQ